MIKVLLLFKAPLSLEGCGVMDEVEFAVLLLEEDLERYETIKVDAVTLSNRLGITLLKAVEIYGQVVKLLQERGYVIAKYPYGTGHVVSKNKEEVEQLLRVARLSGVTVEEDVNEGSSVEGNV